MRNVFATLFLFGPIDLAVNTRIKTQRGMTSNKFARNNFPQLQNCLLSTPHQMEDGDFWLPVVRCRWSHVKLTSRHEQGCSIRYCSMYVCVCVACVLPIPFCNCIDMALVAAASAAASALCWCDKLTDALQRIRLTYSLCWACGFFHGWSQNVSGNSID